MNQMPQTGDNKTGAGFAPDRAREMTNAPADLRAPTSHGDGRNPGELHVEYANEGIRIGSIPRMGGDGEPIREELAPFLDKLGARLAFERSGVRLYDALLAKFDAYGGFSGGPSREDLWEIRTEEHQHLLLLQETIQELGGDATAMTPSANLESAIGKGVGVVVGDPRTTLLEGLEAIVVTELSDNENWEALAELAELGGLAQLVESFQQALATEATHLEKVRAWVAAGQGRIATVA
jgi:hypothetical protein